MSPPLRHYPSLQARLAVLGVAVGTVVALLGIGYAPVAAIATTLAAAADGVKVGFRLAPPYLAPKIRVTVLVVILVFVITLTTAGYPPLVCVPIVLVTVWCATEIARRLTGSPSWRAPRLIYA
jgi:hypothetical protein